MGSTLLMSKERSVPESMATVLNGLPHHHREQPDPNSDELPGSAHRSRRAHSAANLPPCWKTEETETSPSAASADALTYRENGANLWSLRYYRFGDNLK